MGWDSVIKEIAAKPFHTSFMIAAVSVFLSPFLEFFFTFLSIVNEENAKQLKEFSGIDLNTSRLLVMSLITSVVALIWGGMIMLFTSVPKLEKRYPSAYKLLFYVTIIYGTIMLCKRRDWFS